MENKKGNKKMFSFQKRDYDRKTISMLTPSGT